MRKTYAILQDSINNDGLWYPSISIYFGGCDKPAKCKGCHNPEMQRDDVEPNTTLRKLKKDIETELVSWLKIYDVISICYLGGEPLSKKNRKATKAVSKYFKRKYKDSVKNIVYSWREINSLKHIKKYVKHMDYGVLGEYDENCLQLEYVPSSGNQYIYDFHNKKKIPAIRKEI